MPAGGSMRYGYDRNRYGGATPDSVDAEFAGRVEYVGAEPRYRSGVIPALQTVGVTVTDVRRGSRIAVGDYVDLDVLVVAGQRHVGAGSTGLPALDPSMIQNGVTLVAWANLGADQRWRTIDISTDGPASSGNYAGRERGGNRYSGGGYAPARGGSTYGRPYAYGQGGRDRPDYPTNVFVLI